MDFADEEEDEFPLGDGTADTSAVVACPYCWQRIEITLDPGSGTHQEYEEDCEVCCRPWTVEVDYDESGTAAVTVSATDATD